METKASSACNNSNSWWLVANDIIDKKKECCKNGPGPNCKWNMHCQGDVAKTLKKMEVSGDNKNSSSVIL